MSFDQYHEPAHEFICRNQNLIVKLGTKGEEAAAE